MLKKSLLLMLLMTLLVPWAANAQNTLPLYETGTATSEYVPFYGWYGDEVQTDQMIYPADQLTAMVGASISQMVFFWDSQYGSNTLCNWVVKMGTTTATTLSGIDNTTALTQVYSGAMSFDNTEKTMTIVFDNAFVYSGGNLLIQFTNPVTNNSAYHRYVFLGVEATGASYCYSAQRNFLPRVTFTYEELTEPWISLNPSAATVITGFTQDITASYGNVTGTPTITYSSSNSKVASVTGSGTSATVTGNSVGTATITATMTYNATEYTATCAVTVEEPSYCKPAFSYPSDDYIANFATTGGATNIDNTTTYETGGYSNYYEAVSASIEAGETLSCTVTPSSTSYAYGHAIWVDWNKNYEFEASERVAYSTASATGNWTGEFEVPSTTAAGDYRLRVLHVYNGTNVTDPCMSGNYGEGEDYKLTVTAANPYQKPVNLQVSELAATSATITWEAPNSDVLSYKYQYREEGGTWTDLTTTTALSAPLPALTGNTAYNFQVQAIYAGGNESAFASTSFTTPCDAFSIDPTAYQYGFETADDMDCWELVNGVTNTAVWDNATIEYNFGYEPARTGDYCFMFFYVDYDDTDPEYQTLISPQLTDLPANGVHVEFYYVGDLGGGGQETFRVGYSTTDKNLSSFTWGTEITDASTAYQRFSANYPQGTKYVAVQHTSDDQYYLFLDDFTFEGAADCLEPSSVLADNITTTGASINWTAGGEEVAWDIYVTDDATIVPDDGTTPTYANISTKPYPLTPLTPATTYYVYVRAACKGTETSAWSTPGIFHTECEGMDLPYGPYGFEDGALSVCWNVINTNTSYNSVTVSVSNPNTGTHSLDFYRGSYDGDLVAVLPEVGAYDLSDYQFEFSAKGGYAGYEITIGIMTDPDDFTTFVAQGDVITTTTSYAEHKVRFNEYTGTGKYVAISVVRPTSVTYGRIYVDDIAINLIPSCIEPSGLAVSDETAHGATFSWTNGGAETEWHLYVSTENNAPADDIDLGKVTVTDSNPFTMTTGLDPETDYYVWVRANCGSTDGYSTWVGPETFTTEVACPAPTGLAANNITGHTADLSWDGTSNSYNVRYRTAADIDQLLVDEGFEGGSMPTGWTHIGEGEATVQAPYSTHVHGGSNVLRFSGTTDYNLVVLPSFGVETNQLAIDFWSKAEGSSSGTFEYGYVTDNTDASSFTKLGSFTAGSTNVYQHVENFSMSSAPDGAYIAFRHKSGSSSWYWFIDDVKVGTLTTPGTWTTKTPDASPYTATGLLAETKYEAQVQGNCGGEGLSQWSSSIFFTTDIACPAPTGLAYSNPKSDRVTLSWTTGGSADWVVAYKKDTDSDFTTIDVNISDVTEEAGVITYVLEGLASETNYIVKVQDNCEPSYTGDGQSVWTSEITFETLAACAQPTNVTVSNVGHFTADVAWTGDSDFFYVDYRTASSASTNQLFFEGFETYENEAALEEVWTVINNSSSGGTANNVPGMNTVGKRTDTYGFMFSSWNSSTTGYDQYLITPKLNVTGIFKFYYRTQSISYGYDKFRVGYSSTDNDVNSFVWKDVQTVTNTSYSDEIYYEEVIPEGTQYIAINYCPGGSVAKLYIDDISILEALPAGAWQTLSPNPTTTTANLTGLTIGTKYDVRVSPECEPTLYSDVVSFTTLADMIFITEGEWGNATNWLDNLMPTLADNVKLQANATIASTDVAEADKITLNGKTLTINDGGQLKTNNNVTATVKKHIKGYGAAHTDEATGYYLIANPLNSTIYTSSFASIGLTSGTYDLYSWSYSSSQSEWKNYKANTFSLMRKTGYLYANESDVDLTYSSGTVPANNTEESISLNYSSTPYALNGWNLVGNPFACDAYIKDATAAAEPVAFYRMNDTGSGFEAVIGAVKPMEGIFVQATAADQSFKFTRELPSTSNGNGNLNIALAQNVNSRDAVAATDKAIVRFDGGQQLGKFSFRENSTKVYIPQNDKEFAVVSAEANGTLPVNLKVAETGNYTISFSAEDMEFTYLHLIDRLTGEDIDLLVDDSYTFLASVRDQENRFTLVFNSIDSNIDITSDIFAYQNGDEIIVSGEGELQIFDVMGRFVTSRTVNGTESISASQFANNVYIFRMVGETVKTQKIVVR